MRCYESLLVPALTPQGSIAVDVRLRVKHPLLFSILHIESGVPSVHPVKATSASSSNRFSPEAPSLINAVRNVSNNYYFVEGCCADYMHTALQLAGLDWFRQKPSEYRVHLSMDTSIRILTVRMLPARERLCAEC